MDNDATAIHIEAPFAESFPLPFRVFVLVGTGFLAWATNLHALIALRIDVAGALDLRPLDADHAQTRFRLTQLPGASAGPQDALAHARAVYRLCAAYAMWVFAAWTVFRTATHGDALLVDAYKFVPAVTALSLVMFLISPFNILERRLRDLFLHALRRCFAGSPSAPVYFSDVVLADVLTSFAKVIGDVWLSFCMIMPGGSLLIFPSQEGWSSLLVPCLMSIPYAIRFRQCIIDYLQPTTTTKKSLYNALKYASSFPVIFLSAAQRVILLDGEELEEHPLFRLWLLSVLVNSLYSFWWDVTYDWGLEFLKQKPRIARNSVPPRPLILPSLQSNHSAVENGSGLHSRTSLCSSAHGNSNGQTYPQNIASGQRKYPWGLRQTLLYPLPVYPLVVFLNLLLRLTWSLKLSAHLHARAAAPSLATPAGLVTENPDAEGVYISGALLFFWLELAEILRRWMWVFLRVEWECVRRTAEREESVAYGEDAVDGLESGVELAAVRIDREDDGTGRDREGSMLFDAGKDERDPP